MSTRNPLNAYVVTANKWYKHIPHKATVVTGPEASRIVCEDGTVLEKIDVTKGMASTDCIFCTRPDGYNTTPELVLTEKIVDKEFAEFLGVQPEQFVPARLVPVPLGCWPKCRS